jgi:arylsulfatase A-like enzyme
MRRQNLLNICLAVTLIGVALGISSNGNPIVRTPNLDRLATESLCFTNFHVDPWSAPTRSALLTGRYSQVGGWEKILSRNMLRDGEVTIADAFHYNGYHTGLFGKWHLGTNYPYRLIVKTLSAIVLLNY